MDRAWIVADLHLDASEGRRLLFAKLLERASDEEAPLFILGDLFHYWFGRKHFEIAMFEREIELLERAADRTAIALLPGNRDFLVDSTFAAATGVEVGGDAIFLSVGDRRAHLSHGDLFCTSDLHYQAMRQLIRSWPIRTLAHSLPTSWVNRIASRLRDYSEDVVPTKAFEVLEPDRTEVAALVQAGFDTVVCGHFHRYLHELYDEPWGRGEFYVLEPFEERGFVLEATANGWNEWRIDA